jgi:galactokinase
MTGGGFGGSIVALVEHDRARAVADEITASYPGGVARVTAAAGGAREL